MKNLLFKLSSCGLALTAMIIIAGPALCDEVSITTTTVSDANSFAVTNTGGTPRVLIMNSALEPVVIESKLSLTPTPVVMRSGTITGFVVWKPDDLITRRDELLARIAVEHACGKLSADERASFIAKVHSIDSDRSKLTAPCTVSYFKQVKRMYRDYDRLANDIRANSHEGDKQLAGTYNYLVL